MTSKLRVGVLFGGQSGEHEVSLASGRAIIEQLDRSKYEVVPIGITKQGRWLAGSSTLQVLEAHADLLLLPGGPHEQHATAALTTLEGSSAFTLLQQTQPVDVIFPVLHGPLGEDGTVQGLFELAGIAYVGCGVLASAVGMDKAMMKHAFHAAGLPILPWTLVRRVDWQHEPISVLATLEARHHYPMFVKPANMGSSVGISKASDQASLQAALETAARYDRRLVVEQGIPAREIEVSVLGNETPLASLAGEILPANEWYDYDAKYLDKGTQLLIPAPLDAAIAQQARSIALQAFQAIDAAGLARIDFLLDRTNMTLYLSEANTMPGFTPMSMYARLWQASGLSYPALLDRLIELALERQQHSRSAGSGSTA